MLEVLVTTLMAVGINVITPDLCPPQFGGLYHPPTRTLAVCLNTTKPAERPAVLTHEAVHVAQHCATGRMPLQPIWKRLPPDQQQLARNENLRHLGPVAQAIRDNYRKAHWEVEYEAFALQDNPVLVNNLVRTFCTK